MNIDFKQGIISAPTNYLQIQGNSVSLHVDNVEPLMFTCANGKDDYLFSEFKPTPSAWNINLSEDSWLYIDFDTRRANKTFGITNIDPFQSGNENPNNLPHGSHFFNYEKNQLFEYVNGRWVKKIRIFLGKFVGGQLSQIPLGSQYNFKKPTYAGSILYDSKKRVILDNDNSFLTTETPVYIANDDLNRIQTESLLNIAKAIDSIPKFHCVSLVDVNKMKLSIPKDTDYPCVGIVVSDTNVDELARYITTGIVRNRDWNFSDPPMTPVWVGASGQVTTKVPNRYSMQQVGHTINRNTIMLNIGEQILINYEKG